jgi:hypothetical protein
MEIQRIWNMDCFVIPVIIGATGIVTKQISMCLETILRKRSVGSLQETAVLAQSV